MKLLTVLFEEKDTAPHLTTGKAQSSMTWIFWSLPKTGFKRKPAPVAEKALGELKILSPIVNPAQDVLCPRPQLL